MERRDYLTTGVAIASSLIVAGCSGQQENGRDETAVEEHLDTATDAMDKAGEAIGEESEKFTSSDFEDGAVDVRPAPIYDYLDTAEANLDDAQPNATEDQLKKIDFARNWIDVARNLTGFLDVFAEGYSEANSGFSYMKSERFSDAEEQLETAEGTLTDADDQLTITQSSLEKIDSSEMDQLDAVSLTEFEDALGQLDEMVPALITLTKGMKHFSRGSINLEEGSTAIDSERYDTAQEEFRDASNDFATAHSLFIEQEGEAPQSMKSSFIELTCRAGSLRDACEHLANGVAEIPDGDQSRAEVELEKAEEALNRCDSF